ncbi:hypothetical protein NCCNTM_03360 [Mycolicibacterium sp. NCC-Tsukiji]|nr:hypothetical protein NCCNTM_03360 [Mycolicibacterium sp. NCC-Tsukiji]
MYSARYSDAATAQRDGFISHHRKRERSGSENQRANLFSGARRARFQIEERKVGVHDEYARTMGAGAWSERAPTPATIPVTACGAPLRVARIAGARFAGNAPQRGPRAEF